MNINKLRFCLSIKETGETSILLITECDGETVTYYMDVPTFTKYANKESEDK